MKNLVTTLFIAIAVLVAVLIAGTTWATAATVSPVGTSHISFSGGVEDGDAKRLEDLMEATGITEVHMSSPGGAAVEAYRIGSVLRRMDASVTVKEGETCLSACAIAFMGGTTQKMEGILGFHVAWSTRQGSYSEGLKSGQYIGTVTSAYMFNMGYTAQLMHLVGQVTDAETFLILSQTDLDMFKMVDSNYTASVELPKLWLYERVADPLRMFLLKRGY